MAEKQKTVQHINARNEDVHTKYGVVEVDERGIVKNLDSLNCSPEDLVANVPGFQDAGIFAQGLAEENALTTNDDVSMLLGSVNFDDKVDLGMGKTAPLGQVVNVAYKASGMSVEGWNSLSDTDRDQRITLAINNLRIKNAQENADVTEGGKGAQLEPINPPSNAVPFATTPVAPPKAAETQPAFDDAPVSSGQPADLVNAQNDVQIHATDGADSNLATETEIAGDIVRPDEPAFTHQELTENQERVPEVQTDREAAADTGNEQPRDPSDAELLQVIKDNSEGHTNSEGYIDLNHLNKVLKEQGFKTVTGDRRKTIQDQIEE